MKLLFCLPVLLLARPALASSSYTCCNTAQGCAENGRHCVHDGPVPAVCLGDEFLAQFPGYDAFAYSIDHGACLDLSGRNYLCCKSRDPRQIYGEFTLPFHQCTECDELSVEFPSQCDGDVYQGVIDLGYSQCDPVPPKDGGAMDDPHFKTWAGQYYDFMGACDLHLLQAPGLMTIDIRTKIKYDYSYIESAVVQIGGNNETLEVGSYGNYFLNGVADVPLPALIAGFPITQTYRENVHKYKIHISDTETIKFKVYKDWVSVTVANARSSRFHGSRGMMGEFETGKLLPRDGTSLLEDPTLLAAEWQVREDEPMLFQTIRAPQHPQKCQLPTKVAAQKRRLGELSPVTRQAAEAACAGIAGNVEGCIHDVMVTGDVELAAAIDM